MTLSEIALDQRLLLSDADRFRIYHPDIFQPPEKKIGVPHYVTIVSDTAMTLLYVGGDRNQELGAEFRRIGSQWKIVHVGITPK